MIEDRITRVGTYVGEKDHFTKQEARLDSRIKLVFMEMALGRTQCAIRELC